MQVLTYFTKYRTRAIITRRLYEFISYYTLFEDHFFVFQEFFQKILSFDNKYG